MVTTALTLDGALSVIRQFVPRYSIRPKATCGWQRGIGRVLGVLGNKAYMTEFYTTIGYTTYAPDGRIDIPTVFHEGRHAYQAKRHTRVLMSLLYLLPQVLGFMGLLALPFTTWRYGAWGLTVAMSFLFFLPLPAYWRMRFELDAYAVSLAVRYWCTGEVRASVIDYYVNQFTNANYFYMWPFRTSVLKRLRARLAAITTDQVLIDPYYLAVHEHVRVAGALVPMVTGVVGQEV